MTTDRRGRGKGSPDSNVPLTVPLTMIAAGKRRAKRVSAAKRARVSLATIRKARPPNLTLPTAPLLTTQLSPCKVRGKRAALEKKLKYQARETWRSWSP